MASKFVNSLTNWPPQAAGVFSTGDTFAVSAEEVIITSVVRVVSGRIDFIGKYEGHAVNYSLDTEDEKTAQKVAKILVDHIGKTLLTAGMAIIPND